MLSATALIAIDLALLQAMKTYRGPPIPALLPTVLVVGAFGITCAIPGVLAGKTLKWCGTGFLIGFATGGAMALLKLFLVNVAQTVWRVPPWVYFVVCLTAGTTFVFLALQCMRACRVRWARRTFKD